MRKKHEMKRAQPGEFEHEWHQFPPSYFLFFYRCTPCERFEFTRLLEGLVEL